MPCSENPFPQTTTIVDLSRLAALAKPARGMLNDFFESAWKQRELAPEKHAPSFLLAWLVLSASAEVTTGLFGPLDWLSAIHADAGWAAKFNTVMDNPKSLMRMYTRRFASSWPIFDVTELRQKGVLRRETPTREDAILIYQSAGAEHARPGCWHRHLAEGTAPLPDWEHTLSAWLAVRANMFADPGWINTENETRIVSNAFLSLIYFFKESRMYFENPSLKPDIFDRTQVLSSL